MLKLTFLGTGTSQGVPMIGCDCEVCTSADKHDKRLRSSVMIESGTTRIIIDAGPDFRYQMLRENIKHIDAILLTHEHKDHIAGIDDVRAFNYFCSGAIPIYATERVARVVKKDFDYAFSEYKYPGVPEIDLNEITGENFTVGDISVTPINGRHYQLPVTGFRVGKLAYLTDFNHIEESEIEKLKGIETLVINALRHEKHISHFNVSEAIEVSRKTEAKHTYLTHMSHQIGLYEAAKHTLPADISYAYDGLTVTIND